MSVAPVYDTPVQSSDQLELKLPYWRAALAYGWICGQDERTPGHATVGIRQALYAQMGTAHAIHDELALRLPYQDWMVLLGWLTAQGLCSPGTQEILDDPKYTGPEPEVARFAAAVDDLVYP